MQTTQKNQKGTILILFALLLIVLLGFGALAIDVGNWYAVQAELSKSVDAAALAGARNISSEDNGKVDMQTLIQDVGRENFPAGLLGTPTTGEGIATFTATQNVNRISISGSVKSPTFLARLFGVGNQVLTNSFGEASMNKVQIMLVLDRSGSMGFELPTKMSRLKTAAIKFIGFFKDTQSTDKMGLVSYATTPSNPIDFALNINYVDAMTTAIGDSWSGMHAGGYTNTEDAIAQGGAQLPDQSAYAAADRVNQFLIFFSDGMPTALRSKFKYNNTDNDGVVVENWGTECATTTWGTCCSNLYDPISGNTIPGVNPDTTGDGLKTSGTPLTACKFGPILYLNTKWLLFESFACSGSDTYKCTNPVWNYANDTEHCSIPPLNLHNYFCNAAKQMAIDHAQELKKRSVTIYVIGLGSGNNIDPIFLKNISSSTADTCAGQDYCFIAPTSNELEAIFNLIAKEIKLRLVR